MKPEFKLIVAGGRDFDDFELLERELSIIGNETYEHKEVSIVSGMARGADSLAIQFARKHHVQLYKFPADWDRYGLRAGPIRNEEMAAFADGLLAFHDGLSKGTAHMIKTMSALGKPVHVVRYPAHSLIAEMGAV